MDKTLVAIVVGLLAGAGGGAVGSMLLSSTGTTTTDSGADLTGIESRLDGIESSLREIRSQRPGLEGSASAPGSGNAPALSGANEAVIAQLEERMRATVKDTMKETWEEFRESGGMAIALDSDEASFEERVKKELPFSEIAAELELSADQEEGVRRVTHELTESVFKTLAGEEGDAQAIKQEFLDAKGDREAQSKLMMKYVAPAMQRLGEFMVIGQTYETSMDKLLGKDKRRKLEDDYRVTDLDPFGLEEVFEGFD